MPRMGDALVGLFNLVLLTGLIPEDRSIGLIVPIYNRKGEKSNPNNYRGTTLLSCIGKLFTSLLNHRLCIFVEDYGGLSEEQSGLCSGCNTVDHVFVLNMLIELYSHKKKKLFCAFINYKKAFDSIHRTLLRQKLISQNVCGKFFNVIYNLYSNAKSKVKMNSKISINCFSCNIVVRQGENLSPVLFALYLNDLHDLMLQKYGGLKHLSQCVSNTLLDNYVEVFLKLYLLMYAALIIAESETNLQKALNEMSNIA